MLYRLHSVTFSCGIPNGKVDVSFNGNVKKSHTKKNTFLTENIDSKIHFDTAVWL